MFRFTSLPDAVEALESIASDYARHCRAARDIAETHFDARRVLETALNAALSTQPAALQRAGAWASPSASRRPIPWRTPTAGGTPLSTSTGPWRSRRSAAE